MNVKIAVIVAVAIIAVAGVGGIAYYIISENKEPSSDYTLLDDTKNIKPGMNVIKKESSINSDAEKKTVVESVIDGKVKYNQESCTKAKTYTRLPNFYSFMPNSFYFDYTSDAVPEGLTVVKSGYIYTIDGKADVTKDKYTYTMECKSFKINYNGTSVTEVFGTITLESKPSAQAYLKEVSDYKTEIGSLYVKKSTEETLTEVVGIGTFYDTVGYKFSMAAFIGATVTSDSGTYAGLDVTVYVVNGSASGHTYVNFRLFVYDDQILHGDGKMDGASAVSDLSIYIK